ncbi:MULTISPECIES: alpha,alpha-phosphotrehalase [Bacillota]|uniref:Alpha,alpha-phosphotrehalase n=2 Tax=Amedibacillus TaxID=2749846 RepID=A0A7G9GKW3_9FIRM|nr:MULTISPECIES: alpha,alpha-phosphotrehalase [Bacillota]QNM11445.1 alpha,alpha-phosphotrehalase [[Eubacterium] hominis]MCH4284539.1 alpha,alpha-phosphotrehalase [Amedibacillus hominis]RGB54709.1 alpha,alpha-phosphotrehalase [Absiella sp. AM22-9]RGB60415.1 alpha,alpha-phosphotrehalase [Absiella sp. AM10-20]RGB65841.1 alpha,alpha-phosphotrehalase [Absiella sp. AM09-45]
MNFENKVVYQIYPKSFYDSDNDGLGDLQGIIEKLDYLQYLGVDYIWMTPFFPSPQRDNGYDVADYRAIDPRYGTMEIFENLIKEAKKRNIDIMLDMVFNHTSTEHVWFQKALAGEEKYKNYYYFRKGKQDGSAPTNWISKFGGNAWEYVEAFDEYYLHLFDKTQADLNWENPEVRDEIVDILKFWMDKGVYGFRFDVVNLISKPEYFEDDEEGDGRRFYTDGRHVHEFLKEINERTFGKDERIITVGEMSSTSLDNCVKYAGADSHELSMVFQFHHLKVDYKNKQKWELQPFDFMELKQLFDTWQIGMQEHHAWNALFWCNHDQPRVVSRFGNDQQYHVESAKMLATAIHMMRGTPYIYQGEEIGMTNAYFTNIHEYRDVESINYFNILKAEGKEEKEIYHILQERSRDNSRTPMQWNQEAQAGFTKGTPWLQIIYNYKEINVENQIHKEGSILEYYRELIRLRKAYPIIAKGSYEPLLPEHTSVFAYKRVYENTSMIVLNNFYDTETKVQLSETGYKEILSNYPHADMEETIVLRPYETRVYYKEN